MKSRDMQLRKSEKNQSREANLIESYKRHKKLERQVQTFAKYAKYSTTAALKQKELKKKKLYEMDKIMSALNSPPELGSQPE
jgi:3-oxoacyl-(acyl-carrier-protein) synthase